MEIMVSLTKTADYIVCMYLVIAGQLQCLTSTDLSCTEGTVRGLNDTIETRLLFSMSFTCLGTIVGWTVAGRMGEGTQYPKLQVWRGNSSQCDDCYYKPGQDIPVDIEGSACDIITQTCGQIFQYRLTAANQVPVQPGDILGVELPPLDDNGFELLFTSVPNTQDHFIFRYQLSSTVQVTRESGRSFQHLDDQLLVSLEINPGNRLPNTEPHTTSTYTTELPTTTGIDMLPQHSTAATSEEVSHTSTQSPLTTDQNELFTYISSGVIGTLIVLVVVLLTILVYLNRKYKRALNAARQGSQRDENVMAVQLCSGINTKINCEYDDTGCDDQLSTHDNVCYDSANHIYETPMNY